MLRSYGAIIATLLLIAFVTPDTLAEKPALLHPQVTGFIREAVTGKWYDTKNQGISAFVCSADPQALLKALSSQNSSIHVATSNDWHRTLAKLAALERREETTFLVDLTCPEVEGLVNEASKHRLLKIPNRWILLNITQTTDDAVNPTSPTTDEEGGATCRTLVSRLPETGAGFLASTATDSDVIVVCGTAGNTLTLVDMWAATPLGSWWPVDKDGYHGDRRPPAVRRYAVGLGGRELRVGFVIRHNDSMEHMDDGVDIQKDTLTKFNWEVIQNVVKMINVTFVKLFAPTYGYKVNGSWTGLMGLQVRGEAEMIGTSIAVVTDRFSVVRYTNFPLPANGAFIFRAPPMSYERSLFVQPFPKSLWAAAIGIVLLCTILLYGVLRIEEVLGIEAAESNSLVFEGRKRRLAASGSEVALLAFGAVCQQGSPVEARGVTGRIITLCLFIGILFLYTSYSASIVALLQSTSTSIRTHKDLLQSKIKLGAENQEYNTYYMKKLTDPIRKTLYEKKIKKNILPLAEGIKRMRTSYFAFHTMRSIIYTEIENTFTENEKCGLTEIGHFVSLQDPQITIGNWSEHTELILLALRRNGEQGIRHRQLQRVQTPKPRCVNQGGNFQSVALIDCEAAFVVLGMGYGISLFFMLVEKLSFKYRQALCNLYKRHTFVSSEQQ